MGQAFRGSRIDCEGDRQEKAEVYAPVFWRVVMSLIIVFPNFSFKRIKSGKKCCSKILYQAKSLCTRRFVVAFPISKTP